MKLVFSISSFNIWLVGNWASWFFLMGCFQSNDPGSRVRKIKPNSRLGLLSQLKCLELGSITSPTQERKGRKKAGGGEGPVTLRVLQSMLLIRSAIFVWQNCLRFKKVKQISYKTNDLSKLVSLHKQKSKLAWPLNLALDSIFSQLPRYFTS